MTRQTILERTNQGANIYAFVLSCYYPGETVMYLQGKQYQTTRNPFNRNRDTLVIAVENNIACHHDTDNAIPRGDAIDFARLMLPFGDQQLFCLLNKLMHLRIEEGDENAPAVEKNCYPIFNFFKKPITNIKPTEIINLPEVYSRIKGPAYKKTTLFYRSQHDQEAMRLYKKTNFDYVTFSGIFSRRNDNGLIAHSGLITIDFDHVDDLQGLKRQLLSDKYFVTDLLFVSPSGKGLKWVIAVNLENHTHAGYFRAIQAYIQKEYNLQIDKSGKDVSRACLLCHDPDVYINPIYLK